MLVHLRAVTSALVFWGYLGLAVLSAGLQAAAVLVLFPLGRALFGGAPGTAGVWVALLLGLIVAVWAVDVLSARQGLHLGIEVMRVIQRRVPEAVMNSRRFGAERAADLRRLLSTGATEASSGVILLVTPVVTAVAFTVLLGVGLMAVSVPVAVVTLAGGALAMLALWASTRIEARAQKAYTEATAELDDRLFEFAWAQPSLRTSRRLSAGRVLVEQAISRTRGRVLRLLLWQIPGEFLFSLVLQLVLLGFGVTAWLAFSRGAVDAVSAAMLVIVLLRVLEQVGVMAGAVAGVGAMSRSLAEVREILRAPQPPEVELLNQPPHILLRGLQATYPDGGFGLVDVDLDLEPGTVTVVVGASGSGKSTLIRVLAGLQEVDAGVVSVAGVEGMSQETAHLLRRNAAVVFQDTVLADASLRENLLLVNPELSQPEIEEIAEAAMLTPILLGSAKGWETPVGERGSELSGGERQRVGIARALAKRARLLLIDEATSALDPQNERAIVESIRKVRHEYTTVVVTHRPMMVELADVVVVMKEGRVVEQGSPAVLEMAGGDYARMRDEWRAAAQWQV